VSGNTNISKRGLFVAFEFDVNNQNESNGILKKIRSQIQTFENNNYEIDFYNPYINKNHKTRRILRRLPFYYLNKWNFDYSNILKYEFIYIRKAWFMDGDLIKFLNNVKSISKNIKIILEVPTYPYDNEGKMWHMIPLLVKDKYWRTRLSKYVDCIVTYSDDDQIFGIKTIKIPNAVDVKKIEQRNIVGSVLRDSINLVACSSLYYWHGYDRVIEGMKSYYRTKHESEPCVYFHIVGSGEEEEKYKMMVKKYDLEDYVFLYGNLYGADLDNVYNKCDIGLDSMGRHRSGVLYNSSLKGKEYCAKGLPIVSGVKTELDKDKDFKFYYRVPANDEEINIKDIVNFYYEIYRDKDATEVRDEIRNYALNHFDFAVAMKPIFDYLQKQEDYKYK